MRDSIFSLDLLGFLVFSSFKICLLKMDCKDDYEMEYERTSESSISFALGSVSAPFIIWGLWVFGRNMKMVALWAFM